MRSALAAGLTSMMLCAGCAPYVWTGADLDGRVVCDEARMDQVERKSRQEGTDTHWVNCPKATIQVVRNDR